MVPRDLSALGPVARVIVEILRAAPGQLLTRRGLLEACGEAGLNPESVSLHTTYSELLERVPPRALTLRGSPSAAVPAEGPTHRASAKASRFGRTEDGRLWMSFRVTTSIRGSGVVYVPVAVRPLLAGRRFATDGGEGTKAVAVAVDQRGNSWGWSPFLRRADARPGDLVVATFDERDESVVLELVRGGFVGPRGPLTRTALRREAATVAREERHFPDVADADDAHEEP